MTKIKLRFTHKTSSIKKLKNKLFKHVLTYKQSIQLDIALVIKDNKIYIEQNGKTFIFDQQKKINIHDLTIELQRDLSIKNDEPASLEKNIITQPESEVTNTENPLQFLYDLNTTARQPLENRS